MASQTMTQAPAPRQVLPSVPVSQTKAASETAPAEPVAQWEDNIGDRLVSLFWMGCFGLMAIFVAAETILGFLWKR
jgi:hypothetical protein